MSQYVTSFMQTFVWLSQLLYVICFIPQIAKNYKNKSTNGLSPVLLFGYANGYVMYMYYLTCNELSLELQIVALFQFLSVAVLVFQHIHYNAHKNKLALMYIANMALASMLFPIAQSCPQEFGNVAGWAYVFLFSGSIVPQGIKIYKNKTFEGFSFAFIVLIALAGTLELTSTLMLDLPAPSIASAGKNLFIFAVFFPLFIVYKMRSRKEK